MLHIVERTLKVKGVTEPKNIVGITDTHLTLIDEREDEYSHKLQQERSYMFPNALHCMEEIKEYILKSKPDAVMACGDIIDFPSAKNLEYADDFFNNVCKNYIYTFGNHDWNYPRTYNNVANWRGNTPKFRSFLKDNNPSVQVLDMGEFLIVAVDNSTDQIFIDTLEQFKEVAALGKPMILISHLAFYTPSMGELISDGQSQGLYLLTGVPEDKRDRLKHCLGCLEDDVSREFIRMMHDPEVPIVASCSGHVHFEFKPRDYLAETEYMKGRFQFGLRLSAPQLTDEGCVFLLHVVPDND